MSLSQHAAPKNLVQWRKAQIMVPQLWKRGTVTVGKLESRVSPSSSFHRSWKQPEMVERAPDTEIRVLRANPHAITKGQCDSGWDASPCRVSGFSFVKWGQ